MCCDEIRYVVKSIYKHVSALLSFEMCDYSLFSEKFVHNQLFSGAIYTFAKLRSIQPNICFQQPEN